MTVAPCVSPGKTPCIDYEQKQRYDMAVRALDNEGGVGSLPGTTQLIVDVDDINDNLPRFTTSYFRYIREGQIRTTDPLFIKVSLVKCLFIIITRQNVESDVYWYPLKKKVLFRVRYIITTKSKHTASEQGITILFILFFFQ